MKAATRIFGLYGSPTWISIHAAREGGDVKMMYLDENGNISIHAAREGGDSLNFGRNSACRLISIHAAREGGDEHQETLLQQVGISIHAAREGGDRNSPEIPLCRANFNPRRP